MLWMKETFHPPAQFSHLIRNHSGIGQLAVTLALLKILLLDSIQDAAQGKDYNLEEINNDKNRHPTSPFTCSLY